MDIDYAALARVTCSSTSFMRCTWRRLFANVTSTSKLCTHLSSAWWRRRSSSTCGQDTQRPNKEELLHTETFSHFISDFAHPRVEAGSGLLVAPGAVFHPVFIGPIIYLLQSHFSDTLIKSSSAPASTPSSSNFTELAGKGLRSNIISNNARMLCARAGIVQFSHLINRRKRVTV